nr:hypothetical protein [Mycobacterium leprae]
MAIAIDPDGWVTLDDATALAEAQWRTAYYPTVFVVHVDRNIAHQGNPVH